MCSGKGDTPCRRPGFPIRKPPDQSLVDDSPGTIVASHVLHRFLVPRHPPCALKNLATDARVHCAVLKQRPATHHPEPSDSSALGPATEEIHSLRHPPPCPAPSPLPSTFHAPKSSTGRRRRSSVPNSQRSTHEQPPSDVCRRSGLCPHPEAVGKKCSLERRCSSRTFRYGYLVTTSSQSPVPPSTAPSHKGLGHRLRGLPTFVTGRAVCTRPGNVFTAALLICDY